MVKPYAPELPEAPNTPETPEELKPLYDQVADKKKRAHETIESENVTKSCTVAGKKGMYYGAWLNGKPGGGEGLFKSDDGKLELKGLWDGDGTFVGRSVIVNGKSFYNKRSHYEQGNPAKITSLECSSTIDGKNYYCKLNSKFEISEIIYAGITLNLTHEGGKSYLVNKAGRKLQLGSVGEDLAAIRIAKCISIVKNAIENGEKSGLEYFETDGGDELQADYSGTGWDTDLLRGVSSKTGVSADRLVSWLNASRFDWGL